MHELSATYSDFGKRGCRRQPVGRSYGDEGVKELLARPFVLGPLDKVAMKIIGYPEFDQNELQVDSSGRLQLPLVGSVVAAGKTPGALSEELTAAYMRTVLRRPSVNIAVVEVLSQRVTVEGAVRMPGLYPVPGPLRLNSAIALAQGLNEFAALDNVAVFRTVDGKRYAAIFRLRDIRRGLYADPEIYAGDTIIVGESGVRRAFRDIVQTAPFVAVFRPFG